MHGAFGIVESHEASDVANIGIQVLGLGANCLARGAVFT